MVRIHWIQMDHYSPAVCRDAITYSRYGTNPYYEWAEMFRNLAMGDQDVYNYPLLF